PPPPADPAPAGPPPAGPGPAGTGAPPGGDRALDGPPADPAALGPGEGEGLADGALPRAVTAAGAPEAPGEAPA
ncbi:ABC transporter ATP-binding protein, partial [Streptomyces sp. NPDC058613]